MASMKAKKGNPFERDVEESLRQKYPDAKRTHEEGYFSQYDILVPSQKICIECKRLRGMSWNQALGFLDKLKKVAPKDYQCLLLFQSNRQPCLVMHDDVSDSVGVHTFEQYFGVQFKKHTPITKKNGVI